MSEMYGREFSFEIPADLDLVWEALTTPEGLASWYVYRAAGAAEPGGSLTLDWGNGPHAMGTYDVVNPPHRLRLVYGGDQVGAEEWLLTHDEGVTHVRLVHSLPVDEGATWDDLYGDITRGWSLFMATLAWVGRTQGRLGRSSAVRIGPYTSGAWDALLRVLGLATTPDAGATFEVPGLPPAEVLAAVDEYSLLLAFDDRATLLVDVEGTSLYTLAATYGERSPAAESLRRTLTTLGEQMCAAVAR